MRRMSFWPAALASSLLFALLHLSWATSVAAVPSVLLTVMLFAVLQCLLVRRTGRLGPAMAVHGVLNLVATGVALGAY
jgi:membrane protease YdiL (CAAX protease family)